MNYLAHLYLADADDDSIVGNLLPDFVRGSTRSVAARYGPAVMCGVHRHRAVDAFTDAHPAFAASRSRLDPALGLLRGVAVDVFYDHFLAARWSDWSADPLSAFTARCYDALERRRATLPPHLQLILPHWRVSDSLASYADRSGVAFALARISERVTARTGRSLPLPDALAVLDADYAAFAADFAAFFPALVAHVAAPGHAVEFVATTAPV